MPGGTSLYDLTVPLFRHGLRTYDHILAKAEAHAREQGRDPDDEYPDARLVADMQPLTFQVQTTSRLVMLAVERLTGQEGVAFANDEKTMADLRARLRKTSELLDAVEADVANAREDATVDMPISFTGQTYQVPVKAAILGHNIPNFFFHLNTGYAILRAKGVPIGKADYLRDFLPIGA